MYSLSLNDAGAVSDAISGAKNIDFRTALSLAGLFEHADNLNRYNITYVIDNKYELVRKIQGSYSKKIILELYSVSAGADRHTTKYLMSDASASYIDDIDGHENAGSDFWRLSCIEKQCISRLAQLYPNVARNNYTPATMHKHSLANVFKKIFNFNKVR
ncbi:MAG: hypothetical protein KBS86_00850 [Proteobacteria bacterium]|nr:hypothetical protein [Candidatus Enterousia scatequi]